MLSSEDLLAIIPIFQLRGLRLREGKGLSEVIQLRSHTRALKSNPQARTPATKAGSPLFFLSTTTWPKQLSHTSCRTRDTFYREGTGLVGGREHGESLTPLCFHTWNLKTQVSPAKQLSVKQKIGSKGCDIIYSSTLNAS